MKKMNQLIGAAFLGSLILLCLVNVFLSNIQLSGGSGGYRISLNRLEWAIREFELEKGRAAGSLEELEGFTGAGGYPSVAGLRVLEYGDGSPDAGNSPKGYGEENPSDAGERPTFGAEWKEFWDSKENGEYAIIASDYAYYKVFYISDQLSGRPIALLVNTAVISLIFLLWLVLWYVRQKILLPFCRLSDLPYELSKGNLSLPLKESKDRFFGKFMWGMDVLRENLEENKLRELELQKEKKMLLLSLSHDIKTPLSAICLYAQALGRNLYREESKKQEIAGKIKEKAEEIEAYVGEIVAASHEDFLNFQVENSEVYVRDALEQIRRYYQDKMELNQVGFSVDKYPNCLVWGDLDRIVEVIQNVVENALKYGDGRKIQIHAGLGDEEYFISIRNTGCGLAPKELPHIFDSFFRGSNVGKKPGSGLGLYICRQLMHQMEGEATAAIQEEEGEVWMEIQIAMRLA